MVRCAIPTATYEHWLDTGMMESVRIASPVFSARGGHIQALRDQRDGMRHANMAEDWPSNYLATWASELDPNVLLVHVRETLAYDEIQVIQGHFIPNPSYECSPGTLELAHNHWFRPDWSEVPMADYLTKREHLGQTCRKIFTSAR